MKVAFFSTKKYDQDFFESINNDFNHQLTFFETALNAHTASLAKGYDAVCVFVNDDLNAETINKLADAGVKIIALRCAGFNNVDLKATEAQNIPVVRVPA